MQAHIFRWDCIAGIAMIFAAVIGVSANAGGTSTSQAAAAELVPLQADWSLSQRAQTNFYINTPSIHESVMDELIREEPADADAGGNVRRMTLPGDSEAPGQQSTSMLWPAYKYVPHLSYSFSA
jgi:hypothetical protein